MKKQMPPPELSDSDLELLELDKFLDEHAGEGISPRLEHRAFWLPAIDDPKCRPWLEAVREVDETGSLEPLLQVVPAGAYRHVADLFSRYDFKKKRTRGRPRTPSYELSEIAARIYLAEEQVKFRPAQLPFEEALDAAAESQAKSRHGLDKEKFKEKFKETLRNVLEGRHGATRRRKRQHRP